MPGLLGPRHAPRGCSGSEVPGLRADGRLPTWALTLPSHRAGPPVTNLRIGEIVSFPGGLGVLSQRERNKSSFKG